MPARLGINVGYPHESDPAALAATGATWVRAVYRDNLDYTPWFDQLDHYGIEVAFVGDGSPESLGTDERQWGLKMATAKAKLGRRVKILQWGNEPDWNGLASWPMTREKVNRLLVLARSVFPRSEGYTLLSPGLVSGDPGWPDGVRLDLCDGLDCHPYAKAVGNEAEEYELAYMLSTYRDWWGLPLWLGEYDSRTDNLSIYFKTFPGVERAAVFCWDSGQTAGEGITGMGISDNPRAMAEFMEATGDPASNPPQGQHAAFVEGFAKWARIEGALLGSPLRNERGVDEGWTTQPTSTGILNWVEGKGHCFTTHDGRIFRWQEDWASSREV